MKPILEIAYGAYFVPSYSEQTVIGLQPGIVTQSLIAVDPAPGASPDLEPPEEMPASPPMPQNSPQGWGRWNVSTSS